MNGIREKALRRLRDTHGFMLAEQLITVAILGFLCISVAAGLGVCIAIQRNAVLETNAQVLTSRAIQEVNDQLEFSGDVQDGEASFVSSTAHQRMIISSDADEGIVMTQVDDPTKKTVLVGEKDGLKPVFAIDNEPVYDAASNSWLYTIDIVDASEYIVKSQTVAVKRVGSAAAGA